VRRTPSETSLGAVLPFQEPAAFRGGVALLPLIPAVYAALLYAFDGDLRPEHVVVGVVCLALGFWSMKSAALYRDLLPFVLTGVGYDLVRYPRALWVTSDRVLGCGLRDAELVLFSAGPGVSLPAWFGTHHVALFDLLAAVPYASFTYLAFGYAVWLWFRDRARMRWFLWSFAIANVISFVTWIALPAAPPWYIHAHGCSIDMTTLPSPAGLARVDRLLGIEYFSGFYSRAASVFGALPSMHCAYPMLGLLTAWKHEPRRALVLHVLYAAWMALAAVYLAHHWVLDVLAGWATAFAGVVLARKLLQASSPAVPVVAAANATRGVVGG
jgi:inositol phosphorylceramide synthase catalytic subunit